MRLTRSTVAGLDASAGGKPSYLWDDDPKGFGVKASPGGSKTYVVQFRNLAGASKRMMIGRVDTLQLPEAREKARSILAKVQLNGDPHAERIEAKARASATIGSLVEPYLAAHARSVRPTTLTEDSRAMRVTWEPLHQLPVTAATRRDIMMILEAVAEEAPSAANRARVVLSGFYVWAIDRGHAQSNPVAGTRPLVKEEARAHVLSDEEIGAVYASTYDEPFGYIVRLLCLTGQRRDEVGGMRWSELDREIARWSLPGERTKNKHSHLVPILGPARAILRLVGPIDNRDVVFGSGASGYGGWSKSKRKLDEALARNGHDVRPWRLHDLRRTVATGMARLGVTPHVIERALNHRTGLVRGVNAAMSDLARVYNLHSYEDEIMRAFQLWQDHLLSVVDGIRQPKESPP